MIRFSPLLDTAEVRVGRFDHPREHCHRDPTLEVTPNIPSTESSTVGSRMKLLTSRRPWYESDQIFS
jgi:hypothetical protein